MGGVASLIDSRSRETAGCHNEAVKRAANSAQIFKHSNRATSIVNNLPYRRRRSLLSAGELKFYQALHAAVGQWFGISVKTRLADIVRCPENLWDSPCGWRVSQKHVDFVLYDHATARIIAAIELDDRTHERSERKTRDAFLDEALAIAGVLLLRVRCSTDYNARAIRRYIQQATRQRNLA